MLALADDQAPADPGSQEAELVALARLGRFGEGGGLFVGTSGAAAAVHQLTDRVCPEDGHRGNGAQVTGKETLLFN